MYDVHLANAAEAEGKFVRLVVLVEQADAAIKPVHFALRTSNGEQHYFVRGIDFGLAQADDFVATTALDLLRRTFDSGSSYT